MLSDCGRSNSRRNVETSSGRRKRHRPRRLVAKMLLAAFFLVASAPLRAEEIWLSPVTDQPSPKGVVTDQDYLQLFDPASPWQHAMTRVKVFQMPSRYPRTQADADLRRVFGFLNLNRIRLAIIFQAVVGQDCGRGIEGMMANPQVITKIAERVRELGGTLDDFVLDEPMHAGHYYDGPNACQYPLSRVAQDVADSVRRIRAVFPQAQVEETEPVFGLGSVQELNEWFDLLEHAAGGNAAPRAFRFDVQWGRPWQERVPALVAAVKQRGLEYGVIYNGSGADKSDGEWIASAEAHVAAWRAAVKTSPDQVIIGSWNAHPSHALPETDPGSLTFLIDWYCSAAASACK